ncbi:MAG: hypothetical protein WCH39_25010, partial [Schlesneria sp.]
VSVRDLASADRDPKMTPDPSTEEDNLLQTLIPARGKVDRPKKEEDVRNTSHDTFVAHDGTSLSKALADADDDKSSPCETISIDEFFRK